jgi:hypothetical protein
MVYSFLSPKYCCNVMRKILHPRKKWNSCKCHLSSDVELHRLLEWIMYHPDMFWGWIVYFYAYVTIFFTVKGGELPWFVHKIYYRDVTIFFLHRNQSLFFLYSSVVPFFPQVFLFRTATKHRIESNKVFSSCLTVGLASRRKRYQVGEVS